VTAPLLTRLAVGLTAHGRPGPLLLLLVPTAVLVAAATVLLLRRLRLRGFAAMAVASGGVLAAGVLLVPLLVPAAPAAGPTTAAATPGVPLARTLDLAGHRVPVLVVPDRPGPNLVSIGAPGSAGTAIDRMLPGRTLAGSAASWVTVTLPPGRSTLLVSADGATAGLAVDTGATAAATSSSLLGQDGPECASAVLGALAAGVARPAATCPADSLTAADGAALAATVHFLAARGNRTIALRGDASPRGVAAAALVRTAAARAGVTVVAPGRQACPLLVVAGWSGGGTALRDAAAGRIATVGTYLAPWLLDRSLLGADAGQVVALRFAPRDPQPMRYASALDAVFPGAEPTSDGYSAWLAAQGRSLDQQPAQLYSAVEAYVPGTMTGMSDTAAMSDMPGMAGGGSGSDASGPDWLPSGMLVPASGPLTTQERTAP
jgi:hypothetical protein